MRRIAFFNIPAHGHTNPTIEVIRALTQQGHAVCYFSFQAFKEKIENAGARFIACDAYLPPLPKNFDRKAKYDFTSLIGMNTDATLGMEAFALAELSAFMPDCIVADSMCLWGKLYAQKAGIPMICSTTSFAFNAHTAKLMKPGLMEFFYTLAGIPKMNTYVERLRNHGYTVQNIQQLIQNDNDTETIVYTSRAFQPLSETFGDKYTFIGPSLPNCKEEPVKQKEWAQKERPLVYISLGTVIKDIAFFKACVEAFKNSPYDVILSVGSAENVALLQHAPANFTIQAHVPQLEVLQNADVFITHAGMNSVNESIYFGVPMVMFPQHSEQRAVAQRAKETGMGIIPRQAKPDGIRSAAENVLGMKEQYQARIRAVAESFRQAGGAEKAVESIEAFMKAQG